MNRYERLERIINEINKNRYPSVQDFCRMFEKAERTIFADIAYLRDFMEVDIKFDDVRGGYYNASPDKKLPEFNLSLGEVFALTLGKDMLTEYGGTVFEPVLRSALDKIAERLPEKIRVDLPNLVSVVRFKTGGLVKQGSKTIFFDLNTACEDQLLVNLQYASASSNGQTTIRQIEPLRLVENRGAWYVVAWCRLRNCLRMFALHRIIECKLTSETFAERDVDVERYLSEAFLLEQGDPPQTYTVKFDSTSAPYVREREWHSSQKLLEHSDGSCTLSFTATRMDEVRRWVLGFGASAQVIEPKQLRAILRKEFEAGAAHYADSAVVRPITSKRLAARNKKSSSELGSSE